MLHGGLSRHLCPVHAADFADTMATYSISLGRVLGSMKQGLRAASVADAAEALRKEGGKTL